MLVNKARIAKGATVRWKRTFAEKKKQEGEESQGEDQEDECQSYESRMLACTRCGQQQETIWMQLRTILGYRGIHCRVCGKQELCSRNKCQCSIIWHQCKVHRIDPQEHRSRKADKFTKEQKQSKLEEEEKRRQAKPGRKRKAPEVEKGVGKSKRSTAQKLSKEVELRKSQAGYQHKHTPHSASMLERIKKRKCIEEEELVESRSGPSADHLGQPKHRKVTEVAEAESMSGSSADDFGPAKKSQ